MDLVHSHYVKNINEGLNELDGTDHLYSPAGKAGDHPYWDSKLFDYGKEQVRHFLLSNIKYWLTEFHFDEMCIRDRDRVGHIWCSKRLPKN